MARYIGPKIKISRRFGVKLGLRTNEEAFTRRPYRPGAQGAKARRGRPKEYELQLNEKQKAKYIYGVLERQFHKYYVMATKSQNVGLKLLQILETRLDSVIYRAGFALTQAQARQFVNHGHVTLNGKKASIPSIQVSVGDTVALDDSLRTLITEQQTAASDLPVWLRKDSSAVQVLSVPLRENITPLINEQLIVEYYSR